MKTTAIARLGSVLFLLCLALPGLTQNQSVTPALAGYWNLEMNPRTHRYAIVRFYNNQHQLLHEERLANQRLRLNRRGVSSRTMSQLNEALQQVLRNSKLAAYANQVLAQK